MKANDYLQTSQPHIYAAGDITNRFKFTHTADFTARTVIRNILMPLPFLREKIDFSVVPWCTYTDPEVAHVGLDERAAKEKNIEYDLFTVPLDEVDRAMLESEETGFVKVLTSKGSDEILGVTLVGAHAGDLLHEFVLAIKQGIGLGAIASTIHAIRLSLNWRAKRETNTAKRASRRGEKNLNMALQTARNEYKRKINRRFKAGILGLCVGFLWGKFIRRTVVDTSMAVTNRATRRAGLRAGPFP